MAEKKVLVNLNFNGNQIINVRAEVAASAPSTNLSAGRFYFNSQEQKLYVYTTSGWQVIGDNPSGMVTADNDLTADKILVGDGSKKVKASSFTIETSVPANAVFTDKEVEQGLPTSGGEFPIFMSRSTWPLGTTTVTGSAFIKRNVTINGSTGAVSAPEFHAATAITVNNEAVATKNYVDQQDARINDRISSISGFGRYLSGWDMATGEPTSMPTTSEYTLRSGDYFVISNVPSSGTKYKPNQTGTWQTDQSFAKTATNESCVVGGYWKYDGSTWTYYAPEQVVSLPSFTNTSKGAIKGYNSSGYVYHDSNDVEGLGKVAGWDDKANTDTTHTITLQGDVTTVSGSHKNGTIDADVTISVTIANGAVTEVKIANGAVTTSKIANDAVDYTKIKAKATGLRINGVNGLAPCWQATGNADEYKVTISGVTRNGVVRLCERTLVDGGFNQAKEVECLYEYGNDATGVHSCTIYINSASAPTLGQYYLLCREE